MSRKDDKNKEAVISVNIDEFTRTRDNVSVFSICFPLGADRLLGLVFAPFPLPAPAWASTARVPE